jgi:SAM-dependent methyltransferase
LFEDRVSPAPDDEIYITEQVTVLYRQFRRRHSHLLGSEYIVDSTPRGATNAAGIRCEDRCRLTFPDARFDHLLSFEVLEHIPDYRAALRECARVLKPGGKLFCSAPVNAVERNTIRVGIAEHGLIEHLLPPEYHGDPLNPQAGVLCFHYFGLELLDDLRAAGFTDASVWLYWSTELGYLGTDRVVFVAIR